MPLIPMTTPVILLALTLLGSPEAGDTASPWPQFRGPGGNGVSEDTRLPIRWSREKNVAWRTAIAGRGWSSPIIARGKVFVTSAVGEKAQGEPKKGLYFGGSRDEPLPDVHRWMVYCLDLEDGKMLWSREAHRGKPEAPIHVKNSYASETPATDGKRVFVWFGAAGLFAYDLEGELLWKSEMEPPEMRYGWGTAASPVLHEGRVYIVNDNEGDSWVAAYDATTGDEVWKAGRDEGSNWSTPFVWENDLRTELVTAGTEKVRSYSLDGKLLWELEGMSSITISTPYAAHDLVYISSGYVRDSLRPIYAVRPGAAGDISLEDGARSNQFIAWMRPKAAPYNPTTIVYGDHLYTLFDFGFFSCLDARTGETVYGKQRLGPGAGFTASPWAYRGKVFCLDEDGDTHVIEAGREFRLSHKNSLGEMCMATPAMVSRSLLIRTISGLWCLREGASVSSVPPSEVISK